MQIELEFGARSDFDADIGSESQFCCPINLSSYQKNGDGQYRVLNIGNAWNVFVKERRPEAVFENSNRVLLKSWIGDDKE